VKYFANQCGTPYVVCISKNIGEREITKAEYDHLLDLALNAPKAPGGYEYKLRADNLEWELVKLPPIEPEPLTDEEALTRYANALTGANDPDLLSAAETLIKQRKNL
jgi:hypothetical protein